MNKYFKIICTIIISIIVFILFDFVTYTIDWFALKKANEATNLYLPNFSYTLNLDKKPYEYILDHKNYREPINKNIKKEAIYVFGCSFAYGEHLKPEETFAAKLAQQTNRPVYNFALSGFSTQHMIFQLENMKLPPQKPKYVIYVYINDHLRRIQTDFLLPQHSTKYPEYVIKDNKLVFKQKKHYIFSRFYMIKKLKCFYSDFIAKSNYFENRNFNLLEQHLLKANDDIKKISPNAELIVLIYKPTEHEFNHNWKNLEKQGIKIYNTNDLSEVNLDDAKYVMPDSHPKEEAWNLITPKFIKVAKIE